VWRALSTPDGRRVVGDAIAGELEAQVAEAFKYDADDPRFDAEAAATLERDVSRGRLPNWKFWSVGQVMSQFGNEPV